MRKYFTGLILILFILTVTTLSFAKVEAEKIYSAKDGFEVYSTGYEIKNNMFYHYLLLKNGARKDLLVPKKISVLNFNREVLERFENEENKNTILTYYTKDEQSKYYVLKQPITEKEMNDVKELLISVGFNAKEREVGIYPGFYLQDDLGNTYSKHQVFINTGQNYEEATVQWEAIAPNGWIKSGVLVEGFNPRCQKFRVKYTFGLNGEYVFYKDFINKSYVDIGDPSDPSSDSGKGKLVYFSENIAVYDNGSQVGTDQFTQNFIIKNYSDSTVEIYIPSVSYLNDDLGNKFAQHQVYLNDEPAVNENFILVKIPGQSEIKTKVVINKFDSACETFAVKYSIGFPQLEREYRTFFINYKNTK